MYFTKAADLGCKPALYSVGNCYHYGNGTSKDMTKASEFYAQALSFFQKRVDDGLASDEQKYRLAYIYENGYGTEKSDIKAMPLYKESADNGDSNALYHLGFFYEWGKGGLEIDYGEALRLYTLSSQQGRVEAYYHLGDFYYYGKGIVKDNKRAAEFYAGSAKRGYYPAVKKLAEMNLVGDGIPQDISRALELYKNGIEQGIPAYLYDSALWYLDGKGVEKDVEKALIHLNKAAKQSHIASLNMLGNIYSFGKYEEKIDYTLAFNYYDKAVKLGDIVGCFPLGYMYSNGYGVTKNIAKAIEHYTRANSASAYNNLALIYEQGDGVDQDLEKAVELYTKASEGGIALATRHLARLYCNGIYFRKDMEKAVKLYKKAAKAGNKGATDWLRERGLL